MENLREKTVGEISPTVTGKRKRELAGESSDPGKVTVEGDTEPSLSVSHSQSEKPQLNSPAASPRNDPFPADLLVSSGSKQAEGSGKSGRLLHGLMSVIGRRRRMEDAAMVAQELKVEGEESSSFDFFAVYGGYGGARIANACRERMHKLVKSELEAVSGGKVEWAAVMETCFGKMDEEVKNRFGQTEEVDSVISVKSMGSTALVVLVGKEEIVVANCGDSRAVLCRDGVPLPLSLDQKVTLTIPFYINFTYMHLILC